MGYFPPPQRRRKPRRFRPERDWVAKRQKATRKALAAMPGYCADHRVVGAHNCTAARRGCPT